MSEKKNKQSLDDSGASEERCDMINMLKILLETLRNNEKPMEDLRNHLR